MRFSTAASLAGLASVASSAAITGFNYGSTFTTGGPKFQADFTSEFNQAKALAGTGGEFTSARLYTMIQAGTGSDVIQAIPAAIATNTRLLLGLWGSGGQDDFNNELAALSAAITQYGSAFTNLVDGISVGSEDLYRISPTGIMNKSGVGAGPDVIANFISQLRNRISGTGLSGAPVGHVDTYTAWINGSNQAVINAVDFVGMDAYPYFQNTVSNGIESGASLFNEALSLTRNAVGSKDVWVTETGWPVSGPQENLAVASVQNAQTYWNAVACPLLGNVNTYWYTLQDALPDTPSPSFGVVGAAGGETPLYDLSCGGAKASSSVPASASQSATAVAAGSATGNQSPVASAGAGGAGAASAASADSGSGTAAAGGSNYGAAAPATTLATSAKPAGSAAAAPSAAAGGAASGPSTAAAPQAAGSQAAGPAPSAVSSSKDCPSSLSGTYEFPHLIVPVNKDSPDTAYGTQYNGHFSPSISSLFNFDIPQADAGKTCSLVFLLPQQKDLTTSSFNLTGSGGIAVKGLQSPATQQTTYKSVPQSSGDAGSVASVTPGNSYVISSAPCAAGKAIGYEVSATGSLDLEYFQDYNPSPIGLYITVC